MKPERRNVTNSVNEMERRMTGTQNTGARDGKTSGPGGNKDEGNAWIMNTLGVIAIANSQGM